MLRFQLLYKVIIVQIHIFIPFLTCQCFWQGQHLFLIHGYLCEDAIKSLSLTIAVLLMKKCPQCCGAGNSKVWMKEDQGCMDGVQPLGDPGIGGIPMHSVIVHLCDCS